MKRKGVAVSDVLGTILLLGMAVSLFSVLSFVVLSYPFEESASAVNIVGTIDGNNIILEHRGGEKLSLDTEIILSIGGIRHNVVIGETDYLKDDFKEDGCWNIGEELVFPADDLTDKQVQVYVVEDKSHSILMYGTLQGGSRTISSLDTYVNTINPYLVGETPLNIVVTGDFLLDNIKLYYSYSSDNINWYEYTPYDTKYSPPWQWNFLFPQGDGYYRFCSVGSYSGISEEIPSDADTYCCFNPQPIIVNHYPVNESTNIPIDLILGIEISDPNQDLMDITWYSNTSGSWQIIGNNNSVVDGTYHMNNYDFNCYNTKYYWYVTITDGVNIKKSPVYHFTTEEIDTYVNTLPDEITTSTHTITAYVPSDIDNVTLYYRFNNQVWTTITYDDFEEGFGNYYDGGNDCNWYRWGTYAHQGSCAANIEDNRGSQSSFFYLYGRDVSTPGYTSILVDFWFRAQSMENNEDFWVMYYDGDEYKIVADYDSGDEFENGQFYHEKVWINETDYNFPTDMRIRFQCDAEDDNDDIYIDQVYVNATVESTNTDYIFFETDDLSPWQWDFNFPDGEGYYEFYSIGKKSGSPDENIPLIADAFCYYNPGG